MKTQKEDFKMDLKELLGEAYKEGMTFEEVEAALKDITPPDTSTAEIGRAHD